MAPSRSDLLVAPGTDAYTPLIYSGAIAGTTWLDPSPADSSSVFSALVDSVVSGSAQPTDAADRATAELSALFKK